MTFTLSPSTGIINTVVPLVATGVGTSWLPGTTQFFLQGGGNGEQLSGVTTVTNSQAVMTLQTGMVAGTLTIINDRDATAASFVVTGSLTTSPLVATYDLSTSIGQTRFKMRDLDVSNADPSVPRDQWSCFFADQEIQLLLNNWQGDVDYAAISGLRIMAASPEIQARSINTFNLNLDLGDIPASLNALADEIQRSRVNFPAESVAEVINTDANGRRILWNYWQRRGGT
jgi:hypothetical protein